MTHGMGRVAVVMLVGALSLLTASVASADLVGDIFLNPTGSTLKTSCGGLCPGPYGTVTIHLVDSTDATVAFHSLLTGGVQYFFGGAGDVSNIVGLTLFNTNVTGSALVWSNSHSGFTNPALTFGGATASIGGAGGYNFTVNSNINGYSGSVTDISFALHLNVGTWADADAVVQKTLNNQSWVNSITGATVTSPSWVEAHLSACTTTATNGCNFPSSSAVATAWAGGAEVGTNVPEPGTLALLGSGLLLLGTLGRRFKE